MTDKLRLLFVYGTLMGSKRPGIKYVSEAIINGTIYDLGAYPGVKTEGIGTVHGELYEVKEYAWKGLDAYEGCPHLYKRVVTETIDGIRCYVYHFNGLVREERLIEDGIWKGPSYGRNNTTEASK